MNLLNKLDRYIIDKEYKIIIKKNNIDIINYKEIKDFNSNEIVVLLKEKEIIIKGENLVVSKMQDNEAEITGIIKVIEL